MFQVSGSTKHALKSALGRSCLSWSRGSMSSGPTWHRARNQFLIGAGGILLAAIAYRKYNKDFQKRWVILQALNDTLESWRALAGCSRAVLKQASEYIEGRTAVEEVPPTLGRIAALASSPETVSAVSSVVQGALSSPDRPSFLDSILQVAVSERGQQLVALSTTNAVHAFCTALRTVQSSDSTVLEFVDRVLEWASSPAGQVVTSKLVATFISVGVRTYAEQTADSNKLDSVIEVLSKPQHVKSAQKLVSTFCSSGVNAVAHNLRKGAVVRSAVPVPALHPASKNGALIQNGQENANEQAPRLDQSAQFVVSGVFRGLVADEIVRACHSRDVRATCAAMARAGCAGATDSAFLQLREVGAAAMRPSPEFQKALFTILLSWLLLIPLWCLHCLVMVPIIL